MDTIHPKVIASTLASLVISVVIAIANAVEANPSLLGKLPTPVQTVLIALVPPLLTFLAGYQTPSARSVPPTGGPVA